MAKEDNLKPAWEEGQSGNPNGRPKGSRNRATIAREWLEMSERVKNPITKEDELLQQQDIMTLALIKKARSGDVSAYKELMDSAYGKSLQKIESTNIDATPLSKEEIESADNKLDNDC